MNSDVYQIIKKSNLKQVNDLKIILPCDGDHYLVYNF